MTENLSKQPKRGILKQSSSFEQRDLDHPHPPKNPHFDEQNILETLHPADKDYGFMKIEEPKTPYEYASGGDEEEEEQGQQQEGGVGRAGLEEAGKRAKDELDAQLLAARLTSECSSRPRRPSEPSADEEDLKLLSTEEREKRDSFEHKRKQHYNEFHAVKMARQLMENDEEEEEDLTAEPAAVENNESKDLEKQPTEEDMEVSTVQYSNKCDDDK